MKRTGPKGAAGAGRGLLALGGGVLLLLAAACGPSGTSGAAPGSSAGPGAGKQVSQAVVTVTPDDGAQNVATTGALRITASQGRLFQVKVVDAKGDPVPGTIAASGTEWIPDTNLAVSTRYTVDALARDGQGRVSAKHESFTTVVPKDTFIGYFTPEDGSTVGVGMEVSLNFDRPISDESAVRKAIQVTASPSVPVVGHWFGDQRLDFRPEHYWAPGTQVTLSLRLNGVQGAPGVYGSQSKDVHFTIGRNQVSYVDAATHMMRVTQDGRTVKTIPITAGQPGKTTYNGQMVISEKDTVTRMNGSTVGFGGEYDIPDVPHAMRLTQSGTFIHGNYWASGSTFGSANTSHGCVSMHDVRGAGDPNTPAAWFFSHSMIGDVVVVSHSPDKTVAPDNGLNGWNMPWSQWTSS